MAIRCCRTPTPVLQPGKRPCQDGDLSTACMQQTERVSYSTSSTVGKAHVLYLVPPVHKRVSKQAGCGITVSYSLFGMQAPQKACRTPCSPRLARDWHALIIHAPARQLRPIAAGSAAKTGWPLHTPRRRIHVAQTCTLLRLRLLLAAGERVEARASRTLACISRLVRLVFQLQLRVVCTSKSSTEGGMKRRDRMERRESPGFGIPSPAARACHPSRSKAPSLHNSPTNHRLPGSLAAMHKAAIHPSDRVRQPCASRA